jgi:hypothetical protein
MNSTTQTFGGKPVHREVKKFDELKAYQHVPDMCDSRRLAHFADWAAKELPGIFIPYNIAYRAIFACARTPAPDSVETKKIRGIMARANKVLKVSYRRSLITERGVGFRAAEDDQTMLKISYQQEGHRTQTQIKRFQELHDIIKINNVPKTAENLPFIDHYKNGAHLLTRVFEPKLLAAFAYEAPSEKKPEGK